MNYLDIINEKLKEVKCPNGHETLGGTYNGINMVFTGEKCCNLYHAALLKETSEITKEMANRLIGH